MLSRFLGDQCLGGDVRIETIRWLLNIKAPIMIVLGLALLAWAVWRAHGFGPMLAKPSEFSLGGKDGENSGRFSSRI